MPRPEPIDCAALRRALHDAVRESPEARRLHRLHGVLLVASGRSCASVASWLGLETRTVERWVARFRTRGIEGLTDGTRTGRRAVLTRLELETLARDVARPPRESGLERKEWSAGALREHVERAFGARLSERQCARILAVIRRRDNEAAVASTDPVAGDVGRPGPDTTGDSS